MPINKKFRSGACILLCCFLMIQCQVKQATDEQKMLEPAITKATLWVDDPLAYPSLSSADSTILTEGLSWQEPHGDDYEQARAHLLAMRSQLRQNTHYLKGQLNYQCGRTAFFESDYHLANHYYRLAIEELLLADPIDLKTIMSLYRNLSQNYALIGTHLDSALYFGRQGMHLLPMVQDGQDANLQVQLANATGAAAIRLNDYELAEQALEKSRQICSDSTVAYYIKGKMYYHYGDALYYQGELDEALTLNQQAEQCFLTSVELDDYDLRDVANINQRRALIYYQLKEFQKGIAPIKKALRIYQKLYPDGSKEETNTLNIGGSLYRELGKYGISHEWLQKSAHLNEQMEEWFQLGENYDNLGDLYRKKNDLPQALASYEKAVHLFQGNSPSGSVASAQYRPNLFAPLRSRAAVLHQLKEPSSFVLQAYSQVDTLLQSLRLEFTGEESKILTQAKIKPVYAEVLGICYEGWQTTQDPQWIDRVLPYFERSKGLVLQEAMQRGKAMQQMLSPAHYERDQSLQRLRHYYFQQSLNGNLTAAERQAFLDQRMAVDLQLRQLRDTLEQMYPQYASYLSAPESPNLEAVQKSLAQGEELIDFFVGDEVLYGLHISPTGIDFQQLDLSRSILEEQVMAFRQSIEQPFLQLGSSQTFAQQDERLRSLGARLFDQLLKPFIGQQPPSRLTLFPDDVLAFLPFEALLIDDVADEQAEWYAEYPFLLKECSINYQFSLGLWRKGQQQTLTNAAGILAIAPTQARDQIIRLPDHSQVVLAGLDYNQEEAEVLQMEYGADQLSATRATKAAFLEKASAYAILHFAGHGNADPQEVYRSFLAFSIADVEKVHDELLFLPELYTLPLSAEMVVLSACQTADGRLSKGEGVLSLTRAATLAGAQSVVSSLWLVNQQSKVDLIKAFYAELAKGQRKDEALRTAKLAYIGLADSPWAHPYHWAGMVLVGNPRELGDWLG